MGGERPNRRNSNEEARQNRIDEGLQQTAEAPTNVAENKAIVERARRRAMKRVRQRVEAMKQVEAERAAQEQVVEHAAAFEVSGVLMSEHQHSVEGLFLNDSETTALDEARANEIAFDHYKSNDYFVKHMLGDEDSDTPSWLDIYGETDMEQDFNEFVMEEMKKDMIDTRNVIIRAKSQNIIDSVFPIAEGEEEEGIDQEQRLAKYNELTTFTTSFVDSNAELFDQYYYDGKQNEQDIQAGFISQVINCEAFKDQDGNLIELTPEQMKMLNEYILSIADSQYEMMLQMDITAEILPDMMDITFKYGKNVTEQQWRDEIRKAAAKRALDREKASQEKQKVEQVVTNPTATYVAFTENGGEDFSRESYLPETSGIGIEYNPNNNQYAVTFPESVGRKNQPTFSMVQIGDENKETTYFVFEDPYQDSEQVLIPTTPASVFREKLTKLYLDHVMNYELRQGGDYTGPDLNNFLSDDEMLTIADNLIVDRSILGIDLSKEVKYREAFKKLMILITNNANREPSDGLSVKGMRNRVNMAMGLLENQAFAQRIYQALSSPDVTTSSLRNRSLVSFLRDDLNFDEEQLQRFVVIERE